MEFIGKIFKRKLINFSVLYSEFEHFQFPPGHITFIQNFCGFPLSLQITTNTDIKSRPCPLFHVLSYSSFIVIPVDVQDVLIFLLD
jgi:hypothetical protein